MRLVKVMTSIAAGVCVLAACSARAQVTNRVVFHAVTVNQGSKTDNGTNTTYGHPKTMGANTAALLHEIGQAIVGTNGFTAAAELVLITVTNGTPIFAVIDGANFYDLSGNGFDVMNINSLGVQVKTGTQSDASSAPEKIAQSIAISIVYDDTPDNGNNGNLIFTLNGLVNVSETRTTPVGGFFTDTLKGKFSGSGGGTSGGNPFVATGGFVFSGSDKLPSP